MSAPTRSEAPSTRAHIEAVAIAEADHDVTRLVPGYSWMREVEPLAGLVAARTVRSAASSAIELYTRKARGEGATWAQVAAALDIVSGPYGESAAEGAYDLVADGDRWDRRVSWRCSTCDQYVCDRGPYGGHPTDTETGHADDCARHTAEIAAYLVEIGWDD